MSDDQAVTADPRVLPRERCVTRYLLDDLARTQPQKEFAEFQDGDSCLMKQCGTRSARSPRVSPSKE